MIGEMKLLLLEDKVSLARSLGDYLEARGCDIDYAYSGRACLAFAESNSYDVLILDIAMSGIDGLQVCHRLREELRIATSIIFLSARDTLDDRLVGFSAGCDDYLVKPFSPDELFYRLQALHARGPRRDIGIQTIGSLTIDYSQRSVSRNGKEVALPEKQLQLLMVLARHSPNTVSKEALVDEVWGGEPPDSDALRTHLYRLRNLVDKPFDRSLIKTVHGKGYRLDAD